MDSLTLLASLVADFLAKSANPDLVAVTSLHQYPAVSGRPAFVEYSATVYDSAFACNDSPTGAPLTHLSAPSAEQFFLKLTDWLRLPAEQPDADRAADAAIAYAKEAA